jgi:UDP-2-acetamido-2,6-beta-L-arabino-hexul-4-ose reductase
MAVMPSRKPDMRIMLSGEQGFIYQNLRFHLQEAPDIELIPEGGDQEPAPDYVVYVYNDLDRLDKQGCEIAQDKKENAISDCLAKGAKLIVLKNDSSKHSGTPSKNLVVCQLPQLFGKWSRPGTDNPVGEACKLVIDGREDAYTQSKTLELLYIDDLAAALIAGFGMDDPAEVLPGVTYQLTADALVEMLVRFRESRGSLVMPSVGTGIARALYATYISYLDKAKFSYPLVNHADERGNFIEILKTESHGQISCLTGGPGVTRGQHYHHSKSEKFLVVKGKARFCFRNLLTAEYHEVTVTASKPEIVETIPGWVHNITNISDEEMIVILWANEMFNPDCPDTNPGKI